ncbi:hypothetical protein [Vibrio hippocampi]|uniref:hypothetical protein n=1 Tax=Vibrio hippocampi TaxID=654686 RepID=UPI001F218393|nr:hypothetical protein [Vibrio hippocampi]
MVTACQPQTSVEPRPSYFTPDNIIRLVNDDILKPEGLDPTEKEYQFKVGEADLNGDGHQELMIVMQDPYFCGSGGCSAYLINYKGEVVTKMSVVREPILLANRESQGWKDFYVWSDGSLRQMSFEDGTYPSNPSVEPKYNRDKELNTATKFIEVQEVYVQDGYDLVHIQDVPIFFPAHTYQFRFRDYGQPNQSHIATLDMVTGDLQLESQSDGQATNLVDE